MPTYPILSFAAVLAVSLPAQGTCESRVRLENIWEHLRSRYDVDGDGRVTATEYGRGDRPFANHDRDGDGVITAKDFPAGRYWNGFAPGLVKRADADGDGTVRGAEWRAFCDRLDEDGDGVFSTDEFATIAPPQVAKKTALLALSFDHDGDGRLEVADFAALFAELDADGDGDLDATELRSNRFLGDRPKDAAPQVGAAAPEFELPTLDDPERTVRLSSFRGKRPVALIFGSYT